MEDNSSQIVRLSAVPNLGSLTRCSMLAGRLIVSSHKSRTFLHRFCHSLRSRKILGMSMTKQRGVIHNTKYAGLLGSNLVNKREFSYLAKIQHPERRPRQKRGAWGQNRCPFFTALETKTHLPFRSMLSGSTRDPTTPEDLRLLANKSTSRQMANRLPSISWIVGMDKGSSTWNAK